MQKLIAITLILLGFVPSGAFAQMKSKKVKDKRYEPVAKRDARAYAGRYVGIEPSYILEIRVTDGGVMSATSYEGERQATLEGIRLTGAKLTATTSLRRRGD